MRIVSLVENTGGAAKCPAEHGLSLYIEADGRKILMDTGASPLITANADMLGIDLSSVDLVVLSHGHYDHGEGCRLFPREIIRRRFTCSLLLSGIFTQTMV